MGDVPAPADVVATDASAQYRRVRVRSEDGVEAWAYESLSIDPTWEHVVEWTDHAER